MPNNYPATMEPRSKPQMQPIRSTNKTRTTNPHTRGKDAKRAAKNRNMKVKFLSGDHAKAYGEPLKNLTECANEKFN